MFKPCKNCNVMLNEENVSKASPTIYRRICKSCRSRSVVEYQKSNIAKRREYRNRWARVTGLVKQYPCITCSNLCYKVSAKAFCSDKCRFMHYVKITESCWTWTGAKNSRGYGIFNFKGIRAAFSHRVSYELFNGPIKDSLLVCHTCDRPECVKPAHLWLGTTQENKVDQLNKDRGGIKLKSKDVLEIRRLYENDIGSNTLAKLFNVTCSTISNIVKRRIWKHV